MTPAEFAKIRADEDALRPALSAAAAACGVNVHSAARFAGGSLPVYAIDDAHVLKLYPDCFPEEAATEEAALRLVADALPIPTPRAIASGAIDGWRFLLMTKLRGESLALAWPRIDRASQLGLVAELGRAMRALHALPIAPGSLPPEDFAAFVETQRRAARERQETTGLGAAWLDRIDAFLDRTPLDDGSRVMLHTEIMREHLVVVRDGDRFTLSGLFDFEPAMRGAASYDFASAGVFVSCGDAELFRALLFAYGFEGRALDRDLSRRLLAQALLHRFSKFSWYLERVPAPHATTLEDLAEAWYGFGALA